MSELTAQPPQKTRVGVVGVGLMGSGMAGVLLLEGYPVGLYNRSRGKCDALAAQGAQVYDSPAALAAASEVILLMVPDDQAVEQACLADDGVLAGGKKGLLVLNCSTVLPATNQTLSARLAEQGIALLDAPVTGSRPQAEAGELYFLVGGPEDVYQRAIPLLETLGKGHIHLGPIGSGACAKLGNNLMGFINLCALAEALGLARSFGVDPSRFLEAISHSGGRSAVSAAKGAKILAEDWSADFALGLAAKDLRLARTFAKQLEQGAPVLGQAADVYEQAAEEHASLDVCKIADWYRAAAPAAR